ncbi:hypothetical protein OsI_39018 [Oryza sativa Indica Group]|uniref:Uncharacterized protein n=2 Tax=Oryza sativa TaxID=4530 RepID=B9GE53_ORYSJ|nr:hypothetical protein OsI_39018 [Oryza sativa Indica Group]EEE53560.1 hypothetical protein OsJ_36783 [Oryza sativa Japonica Group]
MAVKRVGALNMLQGFACGKRRPQGQKWEQESKLQFLHTKQPPKTIKSNTSSCCISEACEPAEKMEFGQQSIPLDEEKGINWNSFSLCRKFCEKESCKAGVFVPEAKSPQVLTLKLTNLEMLNTTQN